MSDERTLTLESEGLRFELTSGAGGTRATLRDLETETVWSGDAAALDIYQWAEKRVGRRRAATESLRQHGDRLKLSLYLERWGISARLEFWIEDGELFCAIPTDSIREELDQAWQLAGVLPLPGLMSAGEGGHFVLPLHAGVLCDPAKHARHYDEFQIYGDQPRWETLELLPYTCAVREPGASALLAIVDGGEHDARCLIDLDGEGGGSTGFSLRYRYTPIDPVDPIDRRVRFVPLRDTEAGYQGVGRRMFEHVRSMRDRPPLWEREDEPDVIYAATSYTIKVNHGLKPGGYVNGDGPYTLNTTFSRLEQMVQHLKDRGMDRVWWISVGWNPEGHDGRWPSRFPIDERPGGEGGFRKAIQTGQQAGHMMSVHDNYIASYRTSEFFHPDWCVGDIYGYPLRQAIWGGGQNFLRWGLALPEGQLTGEMRRVRDLGIRGVYYLDGMAKPLEISYNRNHGERRYRRAYAEGIVRMLDAARSVFGAVGTEMGYLYALARCDSIASPVYPKGAGARQLEVADVEVPVWCMALKGHIFYHADYTHSYVLNTTGSLKKRYEDHILWMAEIGAKPNEHAAGVYARYNEDVPVEVISDEMMFEYDLFCEKHRAMRLAAIRDHEFLEMGQEPDQSDRVTRTTYSDGTVVVCDYGRKTLEINGERVEMPENPRHEVGPYGSLPESVQNPV